MKIPWFMGLCLFVCGCAGVVSTRESLLGLYKQDGLIYGSMATLVLKEDGSYFLGDEVVKCMPDFKEEYSLSYASGTWKIDGGWVVLNQKETHCGNFMSTGDYGNLRFRIRGMGLHVRLEGTTRNSWSFKRIERLKEEPNQALQRHDHDCHAPCVRTCRASHGRG